MAYAVDYTTNMVWLYILTQFAVFLHITIVWLTPPFVIQILLAYFNIACNSAEINLFEKCKECLDIYDSFVKSFRYFLFAYFIFNQSFGIFYIFTVLSQIMSPKLSSVGTLINASGNIGGIICIIFSLIIITGAIDESFESLQSLKIPIQKRLLMCPGEMEKAQMNYLLQRIEDAKPINACGYFEIGKSTLTSMLSIRLRKIQNVHHQNL